MILNVLQSVRPKVQKIIQLKVSDEYKSLILFLEENGLWFSIENLGIKDEEKPSVSTFYVCLEHLESGETFSAKVTLSPTANPTVAKTILSMLKEIDKNKIRNWLDNL